jgi:hypothetical protein
MCGCYQLGAWLHVADSCVLNFDFDHYTIIKFQQLYTIIKSVPDCLSQSRR